MAAPKLRFKEFKNDWVKTNLGEVVKFSNGKRVPLSESERQKRQGSYRYYGASGVIDYLDDYLFDGEYILIGEDGANIITRSSTLAFVVTGKFWVNNHAHIFQSKEGNNIFLAAYLESLNFEKFNSGTAQPKLNLENLKKVPVANPTKEEQTKIATFLSAVDEKISQLSQKLHLLGQYKQGMMQKLFSQQLRFKANDGSEFAEWKKTEIKNISKIFDGTHQTPNYVTAGVPFYSVEHVTANNFKNTKYIAEDVYLAELKRVQLEKGDILLTRIGDIGTCRLIDWDVRASFYVSLALIKVNKQHNSSFVNQYIKSNLFQKELHERTIHVAFPKKINLGEIGLCLIQLPCLEEQTKIANFLSAIDQKIDVVSEQLEQAKLWKKGLLQQMFV